MRRIPTVTSVYLLVAHLGRFLSFLTFLSFALVPSLSLCSPSLLAPRETSRSGPEEAEELTDLYHSRSGRHAGHKSHSPRVRIALLPAQFANCPLLISASFSSHPCPAPTPSAGAPIPLRC
jgi:hypothetical protein